MAIPLQFDKGYDDNGGQGILMQGVASTSITAGQLVTRAASTGQFAPYATTNLKIWGIATSTSTSAGVVQIQPILPGKVYSAAYTGGTPTLGTAYDVSAAGVVTVSTNYPLFVVWSIDSTAGTCKGTFLPAVCQAFGAVGL